MLESYLNSPDIAGQELSWSERGLNIIALTLIFTTDYFLYNGVSYFIFSYLMLSVMTACISLLALTVVITLVLYFFAMRDATRKGKHKTKEA